MSHLKCGLLTVASHNPDTVSRRCDLTLRSASSFSLLVCASVASRASSLALCCAMAGAKPSAAHRSKNQIGSLLYNAKQAEMQIMEGRLAGVSHKAAAKRKYGW